MDAASLQPLPPPGVALFSSFVSSAPQTLLVKGEILTQDFSASWSDGRPFISVDAEGLSLSHRKHLIDASTGKELCTIRKEHVSLSGRYYAEVSDGGPRLFEARKESSFGKLKYSMSFANANAGGQPVTLEYKAASALRDTKGGVTLNGTPVAYLQKVSLLGATKYELHIAPGLDAFLIVALMIVLDDRIRSQKAAAGAGL